MKPKRMDGDQLVDLLSELSELVEADDSCEGRVEWSYTTEHRVFDVTAVYRVGTSEGQGGVVMFGEPEQGDPKPKRFVPDDAWSMRELSCYVEDGPEGKRVWLGGFKEGGVEGFGVWLDSKLLGKLLDRLIKIRQSI